MKRFMILLIFATLFTLTGLTLEGKNSKGATVTLTKNVFTLEPGQNITLSGKVALQPGIKPQVWGVYAYFPNTPEQFRHKCKLPIVNPRSAWGLVRIIPHKPASHILKKDGSFRFVISTKNWVEGSYGLTFSFSFYDSNKKKHFSIPLNVYAVLEI